MFINCYTIIMTMKFFGRAEKKEPEPQAVCGHGPSCDSIDCQAKSAVFPTPPGGEYVVEDPGHSFDYPFIERSEAELRKFREVVSDVVDEAVSDPEAFWGPIEAAAEKATKQVAEPADDQ